MATPGRSSPSGKVLGLNGPVPTAGQLGYPAPAAVAAANSAVNVQLAVPPPGGSFLVSAVATIQAASGTATGSLSLQFTPTGGAPVNLNSRAYSVGTTGTAFRLLPQIVDVEGSGDLRVLWDNTGAEGILLNNAEAAIQPVTITT
jgi:hypothetical protein